MTVQIDHQKAPLLFLLHSFNKCKGVMSNAHRCVALPGPAGVTLSHINATDVETLRVQKNRHMESFFLKAAISQTEQQAWFDSYWTNPDDHMFVLKVGKVRIGSIGFRLLSDDIDFYNVMMWDQETRGTGIMTLAMNDLRSYAQTLYPGFAVRARVLKTNPALGWYRSRGFLPIDAGTSEDGLSFVLLEWCSADEEEFMS